MRQAIGSSMLLYLVIFFASIIILFFAGIMTYSKAYKAKNRIIEVIEEYGRYSVIGSDGRNVVENTIASSLKDMGYQTGGCPREGNLNTSGYKYCVTKINVKNDSRGGTYYKVTTYVHFDFPILGNAINIAVSGETKFLERNYESLN